MNISEHINKRVQSITTGNRITIISGCLFIFSLFLNWASAGGFLYSKGFGFLTVSKSKASGLPELFFLTLLAAIGCILLSVPLLKKLGKDKAMPIARVVLAILGLLPFGLLPFELRTWMPYGQLEFGGWIALLAALGLLMGAILTFNETQQKFVPGRK